METIIETKKYLPAVLDITAKAVIEEKTRYEAEDAVIPKGSTMTINSESGSSGKNEKYINFTFENSDQRRCIAVFPNAFDIKKPGVYKVSLGYKTNDGEYKRQIVKAIEPMDIYEVDIVNKVLKNEVVVIVQNVDFRSKSWTIKETNFSFDKVGLYDFEIQGDWASMNIDYIEIYKEPAVVNPEVNFTHLNFYKATPEDLILKYENHYNSFVELLWDGQAMDKSLYTVDEENKQLTVKKEVFINRSILTGHLALHFDVGLDPQITFNILDNAQRKNIYQIEDATILGGAKIITEGSAANFFLQIDNSGGAVFAVDAPKAGRYELHFKYRAIPGDQNQDVVVKNKSGELVYGVGFLMTLGNNWGDVKQVVQLDEGFNSIAIMRQSGNIDINYLQIGAANASEVETIVETAKISPNSDIFYLNAPRDMYIHLEKNGHVLKEITTKLGEIVDYKVENFTTTEVASGEVENRRTIVLSKECVSNLPRGDNEILLIFEDISCKRYDLKVSANNNHKEVEIINFDIDHGNSTLIKLPNGKNLLIDSAKSDEAEKIILPYLRINNLKVDYYILTHFHDDHNGHLEDILRDNNLLRLASSEVTAMIRKTNIMRYEQLNEYQYLDNTMVLPKDKLSSIWDLGGVNITVLNSRYDINGVPQQELDENNISISMMVEYKGFKYSHGSDNYAKTQETIMNLYKDNLYFLKADYFYGNHHFHGSISTDFIKLTDPKAVFVSANGAVYARGAYTTHYVNEVENYEKLNGGGLQDTLLSCEIGSVVLKVNGKDDWSYETYKDICLNYSNTDTFRFI